jgi:tRNA threonylcarbamoyl adenosine modification protein YeaZ
MAILSINTASSVTKIAIDAADKTWQAQNDEAERLMPAIDQLLTEGNLTYPDLDKILVIKGPGSFTGLRVGVTVANTIANLQQIDLFEADTFEYWWQKIVNDKQANDTDGMALLIFAGKGGVYVSLDNGGAADAKMVDLPDLKKYLDDHNITKVFGDITEEQKEVAAREFIDINKDFAQTVGELMQKDRTPVKLVKPTYIKKPSITQPKKKS